MATLSESILETINNSNETLMARMDAGFETINERLDALDTRANNIEASVRNIKNHKISNIMASLTRLHEDVASLKNS